MAAAAAGAADEDASDSIVVVVLKVVESAWLEVLAICSLRERGKNCGIGRRSERSKDLLLLLLSSFHKAEPDRSPAAQSYQ